MQLGAKRFTNHDQEAFATLSGDRNPMHLDPLAARRTQAGAPVVHGINGALWALDRMAAAGEPVGADLLLRFEAFLYLDAPVEAVLHSQNGRRSLVVESQGRRITTILFPTDKAPLPEPTWTGAADALTQVPVELDFAAASQARGAFALHGSMANYEAAFPALCDLIGASRVRAVAGLSPLVGMRAPGLHSIFSKCRVSFLEVPDQDCGTLTFDVLRAREMLRQLTIAFRGGGIGGTIDAFVRHPPVKQPSLAELESAAAGLDLAGQRALVVGGSRGLGELTAKLAALAGAEVTVTYATGQAEAQALCAEMAAHNLMCHMRWLDVRRLNEADFTSGEFTHLYYFATPPIFRRATDRYDPGQFGAFVEFYCNAFAELCLRLRGGGELKAFWPSSTAIDEKLKGSSEYVMAKAAGEALCDDLNRYEPGLIVKSVRLPRLPTDQTASVTPARSADPVELIRVVLQDLA